MVFGGEVSSDLELLERVAEMLLWAGRDRAADVIYAALEEDPDPVAEIDMGEWNGAFAS